MKRFKANKRGVTLIELLVVLGVIGVLTMIATPNFMMMVRRNRMRAIVTEMIHVLRNERTRAIALSRNVQVTLDTANKTYSVKRLAYILYDPLSPDPFHPRILNKEDEQILLENVSYDRGDRLESTTPSPNPFSVTFSPSGTIHMNNVAVGSVKLAAYDMEFEIVLYRIGQIYVHRL